MLEIVYRAIRNLRNLRNFNDADGVCVFHGVIFLDGALSNGVYRPLKFLNKRDDCSLGLQTSRKI